MTHGCQSHWSHPASGFTMMVSEWRFFQFACISRHCTVRGFVSSPSVCVCQYFVMICFNTQIVPDLAGGCTFNGSCVLWHVPIVLGAILIFRCNSVSGSSSRPFPSSDPKPTISLRNPDSLYWGMVFRNQDWRDRCLLPLDISDSMASQKTEKKKCINIYL